VLELSTVEGDVSVIANGELKGKTEIINEVPNIRNRSL
jgi:mannose-6-phosphate isomerase